LPALEPWVALGRVAATTMPALFEITVVGSEFLACSFFFGWGPFFGIFMAGSPTEIFDYAHKSSNQREPNLS
jgi:hypothetical protein